MLVEDSGVLGVREVLACRRFGTIRRGVEALLGNARRIGTHDARQSFVSESDRRWETACSKFNSTGEATSGCPTSETNTVFTLALYVSVAMG